MFVPMKTLACILLVLALVPAPPVAAQEPPPAAVDALSPPSADAIVAMTRFDYLVTPGDVYRLAYVTSVSSVKQEVIVDVDGRLNLGFLGTIDGRGLTFPAVRAQVTQAVRTTYPNSFPELIIVSVGRYEVYLDGHVERTGYTRATGLSRLSDVVSRRLLPSSSVRRVAVARDGTVSHYDLFAAERFGRREQDPYLRPGDRVEVSQAERIVRISGQVRRPGVYELLPGEELNELVTRYGDGYTEEAAVQHAYLNRGGEGEELRRLRVDSPEASRLQHHDQVVIPSRREYLPAVTFQGAVIADPDAEPDDEPRGARHEQFTYPFVPGETLRQATRSVAAQVSPRADLSRVEYFRAGEPEPRAVDLHRLLYDYRPQLDVELGPGDRIVIPFGTFEVFITGEVDRARYINVESLTRLSQAIGSRRTPYSSVRDVRVISPDGTQATYDLFLAERFGRREEDPYLRPGDRVEVSQAERIVTLQGEVRRSGTYQLLPGEELIDLVEYYGDGLSYDADPARLRLTRTLSDHPVGREVFVFALSLSEEVRLVDGDVVHVPSEALELPFVHLEGAIVPERIPETGPMGHAERRYQIVPGQTLRSFVRDRRSVFQPDAHLGESRLRRADGTELPVDLGTLLFGDESAAADVELASGDRIYVPFQKPVVIVSGAVPNPGSYTWIPDRSVEYYINRAGGYDRTRTLLRRPRVVGADGESLSRSQPVPAEATIIVPANNPLHVWQIGTLISAVSGVVSLVLLLAR